MPVVKRWQYLLILTAASVALLKINSMESEPSISTAATAGLIPSGDIGFLGRDLDREERGTVLDDLYFEDDRRVPYLYRYAALMVFSAGIASLGLMNDSAAGRDRCNVGCAVDDTDYGVLPQRSFKTWSKRAFESFAICGDWRISWDRGRVADLADHSENRPRYAAT